MANSLGLIALVSNQQSHEEEKKQSDYRSKLCQWSTGDGKLFVASAQTQATLDPGLYDIVVGPDGTCYFMKVDLKAEKLLRLPDTPVDEAVGEITRFWDLKERFKAAGLIHKRGIFLYGAPGAGKSSTISLILQDVIARGGIGMNFGGPDSFSIAIRTFRMVQPTTPIVVVMEDLDSLIERGVPENKILAILDGIEATNHVVFLGSSNYPERLGGRFLNRPSRFDKLYEFREPTAPARKMYMEFLAKDHEIDIDKYVKDTEKLSFAHLRELFIATVILGDPYDESLDLLRKMKRPVKSNFEGLTGLGFNVARDDE